MEVFPVSQGHVSAGEEEGALLRFSPFQKLLSTYINELMSRMKKSRIPQVFLAKTSQTVLFHAAVLHGQNKK